jgi:hypothetical protein
LDGLVLLLGEREQEVLGGDVVVLEVFGFLEGVLEDFVEGVAEAGLGGRALDFGELGDGGAEGVGERLDGDADLFKDGEDDALVIFEEGGHEVQREDFGVAVFSGEALGGLEGFLGFDGEFVPFDGHGGAPAANLMPIGCVGQGAGNIILVKYAKVRTRRIGAGWAMLDIAG